MTAPDQRSEALAQLDAALRAGAARWLLRAVARDMRAQERANGARPSFPAVALRALELLEAIAAGEVSASGHPSGSVDPVMGMAPLVEAAARVECDERRARRAAARGRVRGRKVGGRWLIDVDGLRRYVAQTDSRSTA